MINLIRLFGSRSLFRFSTAFIFVLPLTPNYVIDSLSGFLYILCRAISLDYGRQIQLDLNMFEATSALDLLKDKNFNMTDHEGKERED